MLKRFLTYLFLVSAISLIYLTYWFFTHPGSISSIKQFTQQKSRKKISIDKIPETPKIEYKFIYSNSGYSPYRIEVPLGSEVTFKNVSDLPMWTASDPHPVHSDFGEFDSRKSYTKGETYTFLFLKSGTFGFHNHEKSNHRGIIRVVGPEKASEELEKTKESQRATRDKLMTKFDEHDPDSVFKVIDAIEASPALSKDCHDISHDLGHRAYELFGFSSAMTFSNPNRLGHPSVDDICAGGYMHGILEEVFLNQPELKDSPGSICSSVPVANRGSCFHGVGHGVMFANKRKVKESLDSCRAAGDRTATHRCYEGVWMELFWGNTNHAGADSLGWTLEKPLTPCKNASADEKPACFLYAHLGYLRTHKRDFVGAKNLCLKNGLNEKDTHFCLKGVGITMMKHVTSHHLEKSEALVSDLTEEQKYAYYAGVIGYARLSSVSEQDLNAFCERLETDSEVCKSVQEKEPK